MFESIIDEENALDRPFTSASASSDTGFLIMLGLVPPTSGWWMMLDLLEAGIISCQERRWRLFECLRFRGTLEEKGLFRDLVRKDD